MPIVEPASAAPKDRTSCSICFELSDIENFEVKSLCLQCRKAFCKQHTSSVDPDYCDNCLRPHQVASLDEKLIDEDGVSHEGRRINLTGEFWMSMVRDVRQMSDQELENHVISLKTAVREIEVIRDYRRIALAHGENELEERKVGKIRRLRLVKDVRDGRLSAREVIEIKQRRGNNAARRAETGKKNDLEKLVDTLRKGGVTQEQLIAMIQAAQKKGS